MTLWAATWWPSPQTKVTSENSCLSERSLKTAEVNLGKFVHSRLNLPPSMPVIAAPDISLDLKKVKLLVLKLNQRESIGYCAPKKSVSKATLRGESASEVNICLLKVKDIICNLIFEVETFLIYEYISLFLITTSISFRCYLFQFKFIFQCNLHIPNYFYFDSIFSKLNLLSNGCWTPGMDGAGFYSKFNIFQIKYIQN